ncbi:deoxyribonuclease I [Culex quinquefasciatus]|uniref:Deoxyribonuclease I n=1 Tax=Culex quinquefasciatus TaxID=7176 RepID=B0XH01_CULQU|nr:deoxyribonuclease I [Culex quinquefasciatus]|eukprot:XP_001868923.1 deoxyribonuclease I [Culex quinquefasciatus]
MRRKKSRRLALTIDAISSKCQKDDQQQHSEQLSTKDKQVAPPQDPAFSAVPKWTWKVVKSAKKNAGIAFVTSNNPFRTAISAGDVLCPDICGSAGWGKVEFADLSKGYTYCCTVDALMKKVPGIPVEAKVTSVLTF